MTQPEILTRLEESARSLASTALLYLDERPKGANVLCAAVVVHQSGKVAMLAIGNPAHRLAALQQYARATGDVAGFALVFDGYVSKVCAVCDGKGCDTCRAGNWVKPRIDAIIAVVRTVWGGLTMSTAYGYTDDGRFELRPDRNEDTRHAPGETLDNYDTVWRDVSVN